MRTLLSRVGGSERNTRALTRPGKDESTSDAVPELAGEGKTEVGLAVGDGVSVKLGCGLTLTGALTDGLTLGLALGLALGLTLGLALGLTLGLTTVSAGFALRGSMTTSPPSAMKESALTESLNFCTVIVFGPTCVGA